MSSSLTNFGYQQKELPVKVRNIGLALLLIGLVLAVIGYFVEPVRSMFNNIILLTFIISIGLGSLFFVALEYVTGAIWSVPFRRVMEFLAATLLIVPIIALPLLFNLHDIFHWTHPEVMKTDKLLAGKAPYLNEEFFIVRFLVFAALWILFYYAITLTSKKQDSSKETKLTRRNIKISAVFIPVFALTVSFTAIDWLMTLEPHWFSTIYGVYYFSGTVLAALAAGTYAIVSLNEKGYLLKGLDKDHYYSLGALLFAFVNFWAYIAFSQFLLIWYANLPEETIWFLQRWDGSWKYISILLMIVQFLVPYFGLLSQPSKKDGKKLKFFAVWILAAHYIDLYWLAMPTFSKEGFVLGWIELAYPILAVGIVVLVFSLKSKKSNFVAIGDPKLKRGIEFKL